MKKLTQSFVLFACISMLMFSCQSIYKSAPPYTSVDKIIQLKADMDIAKVNEVLGIQPYDIYTIQETGGSILVYNYRLKDRKVKLPTDPKKQDEYIHSEEYQHAGDIYYNLESSRVFVFLKDGKLKSMMTDRGVENSEHLMILNNNIAYISKEQYSKMKTFRLGANPTYLINKDSTSVIINLGEQVKPNNFLGATKNTNTQQTKPKGNVTGIIAGVILVPLILVLLL